ncbi:MAG: cytochrome c [Pseudolabrys sp.]
MLDSPYFLGFCIGAAIVWTCFYQNQYSFAKKKYKAAVTILRITSLYLLIFAALLSGRVFAADARKGEILVKRWCTTRHVVSADQQQGTTQAPPFSAVASRADFGETTVAYFLLTPHPRMPDMNLSRGEAADLAAYIKIQRCAIHFGGSTWQHGNG